MASSRAFSSLTKLDFCSAASLRRPCQTMAKNIAAIRGTSVGSAPRARSTPTSVAVVTMTTPMTHRVGPGDQVRNPYISVTQIQTT